MLEKLKKGLHKQDFHFILKVMFHCTTSTFFFSAGKDSQIMGEWQVDKTHISTISPVIFLVATVLNCMNALLKQQ